MKINKVTISGADNSIHVNTLNQLQKKYPFVEWGILLSLRQAGNNRFPSSDWLGKLFKLITIENLKASAHLCGNYAKDFMAGEDIHKTAVTLGELFQRIQINFNFKTSGSFDLNYVSNYIDEQKKTNFIFQYNKSNESVLKDFLTKNKHLNNVNMLFDSSGGRGTVIKQIPTPFNIYTGYAGGLSPDNIEEFCKTLTKYPNDSEVWIDVESGIRTTDNKFDLEKVEQFLEITSKYVTI